MENGIELKLYEALGVRVFRRLVFALERLNHRRDKGRNVNYHVPRLGISGLDGVIKYFFYNGAIHARNILYLFIYFALRLLIYRRLIWFDAIAGLLLVKDIYCVMLQRYNYIRVMQRRERLEQRRANIVEKKARAIDTAALTAEERSSCLALTQKLLEHIRQGTFCEIEEREEADLVRLACLLGQKREEGETT
ncbi:MAG: hypothetical protein IK095_10270 [Oscillospiraceae bacterium]|nr:hypothetical protein [Oscillospiraceae bacterium]